VTIDENTDVTGGAGTSDVLNVTTSLGAVTQRQSAFETVNFITAAQAAAVQAEATAVTLTSSVAQAGLTVGAATTAVNTSNPTATAAILVDDTTTNTTTFTHTGVGTMTVTMTGDGNTADTVTSTGTGVVTVNQAPAAGVTTVNLNASGTSADVINFADGGVGKGVLLGVDRVVVNNFDPSGEDIIDLDTAATTVTTAAGAAAVTQIVSAAGALLIANTNDIAVLNFEMGGATDVLAGDLTGASLLANLGGALTITADTNSAYIAAFDGGDMYLYLGIEGTDSAIAFAAADIVLLGVFNDVTVGQIASGDFALSA
jgi:hypothetical protein